MILTLRVESPEVAGALGRWVPPDSGPFWWLAGDPPGAGALMVGPVGVLDGETTRPAAAHWVPALAAHDVVWTPDVGGWRIDTGAWSPSRVGVRSGYVTEYRGGGWVWLDVEADGSGALALALAGFTVALRAPAGPDGVDLWRAFSPETTFRELPAP